MRPKAPSDQTAEYSEYFKSCATLEHLEGTASALSLVIKKLPKDLQDWLRDEYRSSKDSLLSKRHPEEAVRKDFFKGGQGGD